MSDILTLIRQEVKSILYDRGLLLLLIGGPLFYSLFYPFPYSANLVRNIPVAVVDMDKTNNSRTLVRMLDATEELAADTSFNSLEEAYKAVLNRDVYGIIYIESGFQKNILRNVPQKIKLYTDGSYVLYYKQVSGGAQKAVKTMGAGIEIKKLQSKGAGKAAMNIRAPVNVIVKNLYNPSGGYIEYIVPAVFVVIVHQILLIALGMRAGALREGRKKYRRTISPLQILCAKTASFSIFGLGYFIYLFVIMYNILGLTGGRNILGMLVFYIPFLLSTIFLGVFIGSFFREREEALLLIIVTSIPVLFMSGVIWPGYLMPGFIRFFSLFLPSTHGAAGVLRLFIMDVGFTHVLAPFIFLLSLSLLYGLLAYLRIKKRYPLKI